MDCSDPRYMPAGPAPLIRSGGSKWWHDDPRSITRPGAPAPSTPVRGFGGGACGAYSLW